MRCASTGYNDLPQKESSEVYDSMVSALRKEAQLQGKVTFALPGSPVFLEYTTRLLRERAGVARVKVRLIHGLRFVEEAMALLNLAFRRRPASGAAANTSRDGTLHHQVGPSDLPNRGERLIHRRATRGMDDAMAFARVSRRPSRHADRDRRSTRLQNKHQRDGTEKSVQGIPRREILFESVRIAFILRVAKFQNV